MKQTALSTSTAVTATRWQADSWVDARNIGLLLIGFLLVIVLLPPARSFPVADEWAYAHSVMDLLSNSYKIEAAQATALGQVAWGAVFVLLFGYSFTVLSVSSLLMGAFGILLFYLLLRQLGLSPAWALFGGIVFGCNPLYLHLSYAFMTDVPFIVYLLAACLCYVRAIQGKGFVWFWLGGAAVALAYLTRQYGILLVPGLLCYLWFSRKWSWRAIFSGVTFPLVTTVVYWLWERTQPTPIAVYYVATLRAAMSSNLDYWVDHAFRITWALTITGILLLPLVWLPRKLIRALPLLSFLGPFLIQSWERFGSFLPVSGNALDNTGFLLDGYGAQPVWSPWVWSALATIGAVNISLYLTACAEHVWEWIRLRRWQDGRSIGPLAMLYLAAVLMLGAILFLTPFVFDRYLLPAVPLLMIPVLRRDYLNGAGPLRKSKQLLRASLVGCFLVFALVAQRDFIEHSAVRWRAAENLVAQGIPPEHINAGFEWQGWYLFDEGTQLLRRRGDLNNVPFPAMAVLDPVYILADGPIEPDEYRVVTKTSYRSFLDGGQIRYVYTLKAK